MQVFDDDALAGMTPEERARGVEAGVAGVENSPKKFFKFLNELGYDVGEPRSAAEAPPPPPPPVPLAGSAMATPARVVAAPPPPSADGLEWRTLRGQVMSMCGAQPIAPDVERRCARAPHARALGFSVDDHDNGAGGAGARHRRCWERGHV